MAKRVEKYPEIVFRKHPPPLSSEPSPWVRQPARHLPLFLVLLVFSCLLITVDLQYGFTWLWKISERVSAPLVYSVNLISGSVSRSASYVRDSFVAQTENERLRQEVESLQRELSNYQTIQQENFRLRDLLDLKAAVAPKALAGKVLSYRDEPTRRFIILEGGLEQGIREGQPVLSRSGQLLGRVSKVGQKTSNIQLLTDPGCAIGVCVERIQSQGILYNRDGELFIRLERGELVTAGDRLLTSHLSHLYPPDLLIGTIEGEAQDHHRDPIVAADLGLMKSYHVSPVLPIKEWREIREVLLLPTYIPETGPTEP